MSESVSDPRGAEILRLVAALTSNRINPGKPSIWKPVLKASWYDHDDSMIVELVDVKGTGEEITSEEIFRGDVVEAFLIALRDLEEKVRAAHGE